MCFIIKALFLKPREDESCSSLVNVLRCDLKDTLLVTTNVVVVMAGVVVAANVVVAEVENVPVVVRAAMVC